MCTSLLGAWDGEARDVEQRVSLAVIARSPIERLVAFKNERGWHSLRLYSDTTGEFSPPDLMPIWTILDSTPEGRGTDWYPKLEYGR